MQKQFDTDWFSWNIPHWTKYLAELKNKPDIRGLEIGVFQGRSTCWLFDNIFTHPSSRLISVDTFMGSRSLENIPNIINSLHETFLKNTSEYGDRSICHKTASNNFFKTNESQFDFIYIDGDHHSYAVLEDAVGAWNCLKPNGIIIFDDYGIAAGTPEQHLSINPYNGIATFMLCYKDLIDILHVAFQVIIRKKSDYIHFNIKNVSS